MKSLFLILTPLVCMASPLIEPSAPLLNERSEEVPLSSIQSEEIQTIIERMLDIAFGETREYNKSILVGLAAPQIGISKRIILVDKAATGLFVKEQTSAPPPQIDVYINPEIAWRSDETNVWREGCFSTSRICGLVPRSSKVLVRAYDREGNLLTKEFSGYTARIFQHEIDHLDGIRFPDRIENDEHLHWVELDELPSYRIEWASWEKKYPRKQWLETKHGRAE